MVDETLKDDGLSIQREARAALIASLGGDRLATRGELAKLMLYAHGQREITLADVDADHERRLEPRHGCGGGCGVRREGTADETAPERLAAEGVNASVLLGSALRHALMLLVGAFPQTRSPDPGGDGPCAACISAQAPGRAPSARTGDSLRRPSLAVEPLQTRRLSDLDDTMRRRPAGYRAAGIGSRRVPFDRWNTLAR